MMKTFKILTGVFLLMVTGLTISGCNLGKTSEESRVSLVQSVNPEPAAVEGNKGNGLKTAEKVKKDIQAMPAIFDVAVIKGEKEILVAYKVKHMQRFQMKKIEKEINQKLEKNYPKETFIVSSDFKIFIEAIELKEKVKKNTYSKKQAEKQLQKIIKLKKELT
ncbi:YhcN/YlaJ family sporulation lipoprotein [Mesobacillus foraminis]|uniref:YhcN/YlaJ family sporulation lipoprotein n=1 Tax=Mesobacillus foraminis TaxID=279826 RepID=UPI00214BF928|nr:YhcN/YlaJ family sporulation lipoprotein [Mesobacillus foraminis]